VGGARASYRRGSLWTYPLVVLIYSLSILLFFFIFPCILGNFARIVHFSLLALRVLPYDKLSSQRTKGVLQFQSYIPFDPLSYCPLSYCSITVFPKL
jgi:hypothetical protein